MATVLERTKDKGITVQELHDVLGSIINEGKGDYKMMYDVNEYYNKVSIVQVIDEHHECDPHTVNIL